ncbi:hypothetical protein FF2_037427 [Malus domestica]
MSTTHRGSRRPHIISIKSDEDFVNAYGRLHNHHYFRKIFKAYRRLWKYQQESRFKLVIADLNYWEVGEIANRIGQLYFGKYRRTIPQFSQNLSPRFPNCFSAASSSRNCSDASGVSSEDRGQSFVGSGSESSLGGGLMIDMGLANHKGIDWYDNLFTFYVDSWWGTTTTTSIFIAAAITDWLDGYIARKMSSGSAFSAFLDPVADKLMVAATLITMSAVREWAASQNAKLLERNNGVISASLNNHISFQCSDMAVVMQKSGGDEDRLKSHSASSDHLHLLSLFHLPAQLLPLYHCPRLQQTD